MCARPALKMLAFFFWSGDRTHAAREGLLGRNTLGEIGKGNIQCFARELLRWHAISRDCALSVIFPMSLCAAQ